MGGSRVVSAPSVAAARPVAATAPAAAGVVGTDRRAGAGSAGAGNAGIAAGNTGVNVNVDVDASELDTSAAAEADIDSVYLSRTAGIINGRNPPQIYDEAVLADLPRFNASSGTFAGDAGLWPSINPGSRVDAAFLPDNMTATATAKANASSASNSTRPPPDTVRVLDPAPPVKPVRVPAGSFDPGELGVDCLQNVQLPFQPRGYNQHPTQPHPTIMSLLKAAATGFWGYTVCSLAWVLCC